MPRPEREQLFQQLLAYFDNHGVLPDFTLEKVRDDHGLVDH
jgi:hypothetical protein